MSKKETGGRKKTKDGRSVYAADYGEATPRQVAEALLKYRPAPAPSHSTDEDAATARQP